jgi:polysaccharide deacetylase family protein (PEP-CTERM system associated)
VNVAPDARASDDPVEAWKDRQWAAKSLPVANALTVDVEDYFQVEAFFSHVDRNDWDRRECRVEQNTDRILAMFAEAGVTGTFFTLAWVAKRYPALVRRIAANGHEVASHGLAHFRADSQTPREFLDDVKQSKAILEDVSGTPVNGYRAASFSITRNNLWALGALAEAGYLYSSSTYPIRHDLYGIPEAPRFAFYPFPKSPFLEIPLTSVRAFGMNFPCAGGGYFRLLPYWLSARNLRSVRRAEGMPCIFYFHPWEVDPEQPRIEGTPLKTRIRHYTNLSKMQGRLGRLLSDFSWNRVDRVFPVGEAQPGRAG